MAGRVELEQLAERIMMASVRAQFLGLDGVVNYLDMAFGDVVRLAVEEKEEAKRRLAEAERVVAEGGVRGG